MVYRKQFALAIKHEGKILREDGEKVYLPFGSEYKIVLKNLNSSKAQVKVFIDGEDVTNGALIVNPNTSIDLERFIGKDLNKGNRFKFIERSERIEDYRGIRIDDGLVRIEYQFERIMLPQYINSPIWGNPPSPYYGAIQGSPLRGVVACNSAGITAPGSISDQSFESARLLFLEPETHSLCLHLVGEVESITIKEPILVNTKTKCTSCGKINKSSSKFCSECGTSLNIFNK